MILANFLFRIGGSVIQWRGKDPNPPLTNYCERHNSFDFVIFKYSAFDVDYMEKRKLKLSGYRPGPLN
jgi:hypothetical protein